MKFSYDWLKEYVDINISAKELAERLTMLGIEVENFSETRDGDTVFELELTSNRPDCANIIGIAREIGAVLNKKVKFPSFKINQPGDNIHKQIKVTIEDSTLCPRYTARAVRGVCVSHSPSWLKSRLERVGLRSVNNIVDAVNFVLMELGHPLHAFDADALARDELVIRRAKKGEKITTIDLVERELSSDMLVIADGEKPQAVAGIMGGDSSAVKDSTTNVILESAYFNKGSIRRTAKKLNMLTEASYRFERGADPGVLIPALNRAAVLIQQLAGGEISNGIIDIHKKTWTSSLIDLDLDKLNRLLGTGLTITRVVKILKNLEFHIKSRSSKKIKVSPPGFRGDVKREVDLIEEVARHYGYNKIQAAIPSAEISSHPQKLENKIREVVNNTLLKSGLQEVINYSFINTETLLKLNLDETAFKKKFIRITNPVSRDQDIMRPTLFSGLLNNTARNFNRQIDAVKLFETGKIFYSERGKKELAPLEKAVGGGKRRSLTGFVERMAVAFVIAVPGLDLFDLKGIIELLFEVLGVSSPKFTKGALPCFHPLNSALITKGGRQIGWWGEFNLVVKKSLGLKGKIFGAEIILDELSPWVNLNRHFKDLPRFPFIQRDLSLLAPIEVTSKEITALIRKEGKGLIEKINLFDLYQGRQVPGGFRSLGYNLIYRSASRTLTDKEINDIHISISHGLENKFKIKIRGG